ncbi:hypothetical protein UPYG_G00237150 [Umbra pygmaea]|uniref:Uncharacterized protein n=1 Tax=Umbra pygmaea TaxID=75934 RepID=A0ABD0WYT6_UMBPY
MDVYKHPVFFECHTLDSSKKDIIKIKMYFEIRRKSGGGDCGRVESVGDSVYKISFKEQTAQERVLQKAQHDLELSSGPISLTLRGSLEPPPTSTSPGSIASSLNTHTVKTSPPSNQKALVKSLSSDKQEKVSITCQIGQAKLRLLGEVIEKDLAVIVPGVKVTRSESSELVLEGSSNDVRTARQLVTDRIHLVLEQVVAEVSHNLLSFLRENYGRPGALGSLLGLGGQVELELGDTELRLFSLTVEELGQAEKALLGEFWEEKIDISNCASFPAELRSNLDKKVMEMNQNRCRVVARYSPDCRVLLLGHKKQVQELRDEIGVFLIEQSIVEERVRLPFPEIAENLPDLLEKCGVDYTGVTLHPSASSGHPSVVLCGPSVRVTQIRNQLVPILDTLVHQLPSDGSTVNEVGATKRPEGTMTPTSYRLQGGLEVVVCQGDITNEQADALVNAANENLDHAGGVAAALSHVGGPEVQRASTELVKQVGRLDTGRVVETTGGNLPCKILLHAVGPIGGSVGGNERPLLEKTVKTALHLAETLELQTLAMPCIGSGIFGVPLKVCSEAIVSAVRDFGRPQRTLSKVTLIDVSREAVLALKEACDRLILGRSESSEQEGESTTPTTSSPCSHGVITDTNAWKADSSEACVQVEIVQGSIEKQQVDALVSPMVGCDPISSRVGNVLLEEAGPELLDAFKRKLLNKTLPGDTVLVEGLSGFSSSRVFYLSCARWDENLEGPAVQALRQGVRNILTSCENQGFRSVAFPVVGTGVVLKFPNKVATQVLLEEIHMYKQSRANRTPFLVRIVIHPKDRDSTKDFQMAQNALHVSGFKVFPHPEQDIRIVLLGKTGGGKSSSGNTIFGQENVFIADSSSTSTTQMCEAYTKKRNGRNVTVIDTPGLFDTNIPEEELKCKIVNCITECAPGPHAFLIVLKVERYTVHEKETIAKIEKTFSAEAFKYATVLFTHGYDLNGLTIEEFVQQNDELKMLVQKCGGRCHVIDNKHWNDTEQSRNKNNQYQVTELLNTIEKMVRDNGGECYTNKMLQAAEKDIQDEIERLRMENKGQMSEEEMRKQAKARGLAMASSALASFIEDPSFEGLARLQKADLVAVAGHYGLPMTKQTLKAKMVVNISRHLLELGVFTSEDEEEVVQEEEEVAEEVVEGEEVVTGLSPTRPDGGVEDETRLLYPCPSLSRLLLSRVAR